MRAAISLTLLAGFFVVALAILGGAVWAGVLIATLTTGVIAVKLMVPLVLAVVGGAGGALWKALRARPEPPEGLPVTAAREPDLWRTVTDLATEIGTRPPDEIRLVPEVNAAVSEDAKLFGLVGGHRIMYIGLPLLHTLTVGQLRAVLAHELGHYSHSHTRLGEVAYRGRLAIGGTLSRIGPYNPVGWVFKGYARLYLLADNAVSRRQELQADEASVRLAGRTAARSVMLELPVLDAAWEFFHDAYVSTGWELGYAPDDVFAGFAAMVHARASELEALRAEPDEEVASIWDTHPPTAVRVAAMDALPDPGAAPDDRPAAALVPDLAEAGRAIQDLLFDLDGRTVLPWAAFIPAALAADLQRDGDVVFRAIRRVTGHERLTLSDVLDAIEAGRLAELAQPFHRTATRREVEALFADQVETLMVLAAVRSGATAFQLSWSGPATLVPPIGEELEVAAALAVAPGGVAKARAKLLELGVDPHAAELAEQSRTAAGSSVMAGAANVKVDGTEHDLLALTEGFVLIANPGSADDGQRRLEALVGQASADWLAANHRFIPYEEIAEASVTREIPLRAEIRLHDGGVLQVQERMSSEFLSKDSREIVISVLRQM
ncbi:M48 family metallopeptidase [Nonomuraea sp. NPDC050556]|uniref:M48 family metallopeptidase n=1 Tax=Nonomuraea sp. NPDC050556 TaxID=3364369 RepID=UPI0037B69EE5